MKLKVESRYDRSGRLHYYVYKRFWFFFWEEVGFPQPDIELASQSAMAILEREKERKKNKQRKKKRIFELYDDGMIVWREG